MPSGRTEQVICDVSNLSIEGLHLRQLNEGFDGKDPLVFRIRARVSVLCPSNVYLDFCKDRAAFPHRTRLYVKWHSSLARLLSVRRLPDIPRIRPRAVFLSFHHRE